ncbi:lipopolysaccharide transport periplasmic protein LptA [Marinobacter sp. P4B1]|uniref:lipopolysaccharide transport periplasmic protein LptA n=1 Tax=Marinobacter sp. P4B1 TaxID=1119533 RepID=UPI00071C408B|nr:lipopolysaccharide transport periplasmic protein LptA [Marinobacter sp. P4B1]KRW81939.1 organic solvent tolerance protein OstA [Marinobacter sp. P4B1]
MKPSGKLRFYPPALLAAALMLAAPAMAFDMDSNTPIQVSADSARLDDSAGVATYTGEVELVQGRTRLEAQRVVLYRDDQGLSRIEASGSPAHYRQPSREGEGMTNASALNITWAAKDNQLTFERQAVIEQAGNTFKGDVIHYNTVSRVVTAEGGSTETGGSGRVEMVIQPRNTGQSSNGEGSDGSTQGQ